MISKAYVEGLAGEGGWVLCGWVPYTIKTGERAGEVVEVLRVSRPCETCGVFFFSKVFPRAGMMDGLKRRRCDEHKFRIGQKLTGAQKKRYAVAIKGRKLKQARASEKSGK